MNIINEDWIIISLYTIHFEWNEKIDSINENHVLGIEEILLKLNIVRNFVLLNERLWDVRKYLWLKFQYL